MLAQNGVNDWRHISQTLKRFEKTLIILTVTVSG